MKLGNKKEKIDREEIRYTIICYIFLIPGLLLFYFTVYTGVSGHVKIEGPTYYFSYLGNKSINGKQRYYFKDSRKNDHRVYYLDDIKDQNVHYYRDIKRMKPLKIDSYYQNLVWNGLGRHSWLSETTTDLKNLKLSLPADQINKKYTESRRVPVKEFSLVKGDRNFNFKGLYDICIVYTIFIALPSSVITFVILLQMLKMQRTQQ